MGSHREGRVEISYNGTWGTVCGENFDFKAARVVCRQLGFPDAERTLFRHAVPDGSGPVWINYLHCDGSESSLFSCRHDVWRNFIAYCGHTMDAGVRCMEGIIIV